jgi:hypothetical protein
MVTGRSLLFRPYLALTIVLQSELLPTVQALRHLLDVMDSVAMDATFCKMLAHVSSIHCAPQLQSHIHPWFPTHPSLVPNLAHRHAAILDVSGTDILVPCFGELPMGYRKTSAMKST